MAPRMFAESSGPSMPPLPNPAQLVEQIQDGVNKVAEYAARSGWELHLGFRALNLATSPLLKAKRMSISHSFSPPFKDSRTLCASNSPKLKPYLPAKQRGRERMHV